MRITYFAVLLLLFSGTAFSQQIDSGDTVTVPADGGSGGAGASIWRAECKRGTVMTGIEIVVGGTCRNQCNADGRPLTTYRIHCTRNPRTPVRDLRAEN